jgi:hypothetical protein
VYIDPLHNKLQFHKNLVQIYLLDIQKLWLDTADLMNQQYNQKYNQQYNQQQQMNFLYLNYQQILHLQQNQHLDLMSRWIFFNGIWGPRN